MPSPARPVRYYLRETVTLPPVRGGRNTFRQRTIVDGGRYASKFGDAPWECVAAGAGDVPPGSSEHGQPVVPGLAGNTGPGAAAAQTSVGLDRELGVSGRGTTPHPSPTRGVSGRRSPASSSRVALIVQCSCVPKSECVGGRSRRRRRLWFERDWLELGERLRYSDSPLRAKQALRGTVLPPVTPGGNTSRAGPYASLHSGPNPRSRIGVWTFETLHGLARQTHWRHLVFTAGLVMVMLRGKNGSFRCPGERLRAPEFVLQLVTRFGVDSEHSQGYPVAGGHVGRQVGRKVGSHGGLHSAELDPLLRCLTSTVTAAQNRRHGSY